MTIAIKGRFEYEEGRKTFRWKMPDSASWDGLRGVSMSSLPLWGTERLRSHPNGDPVFLVEGEKAAQACRDHGLLGLTHGGGASTTDFGLSLLVLKGRHVVLWPDNDEAGRTYMARLHTLLRPIAKKLNILTPPLPERGDAWDYFAADGIVENLLRDVPVGATTIDYLAHDAIGVRSPSALGTIMLKFSSMEKSSRELATEIEISLPNSGEPYSQRLNLLSGSQVTEMRRNLDSIFGKDLGWAQLLNTAIAKARKAFLEQDRAKRLIEIPEPGPPAFLIPDLLPEGVPTVWFGNGSSLKTYMALRAAISVAAGVPFMGLPVRKGAAMLIDYENPPETFRFRCQRLFAGLGMTEVPDIPLFHWPARGIPLADQIEAIRAKVQSSGITFLAVDSGAAACGGKPEDADIALSYFLALQKLGAGVTPLTVAHCNRAGDEMRPFGSIFWENQPRRTVNFARTDDEDSDDMDIGIFYRKVNDGRKPKSSAFHVRFDGLAGPVTITMARIEQIPDLDKKRWLWQRAWDVLDAGPLSLKAILKNLEMEETEKNSKVLDMTLRRDKVRFASNKGPGKEALWSRVAHEEPGVEEADPF